MATSDDGRPTEVQFRAFQQMYDYMNRTVFGGGLKPVILNFSRRAKTLGFFAPDRWTRSAGTAGVRVHEISLNPAYLALRPPRDVASTLVHEMVHLWQQEFGKPSRTGYHNAEWADKMEAVGLMPSTTAAPGGARVGQAVSHYVFDDGPFARAFEAMPGAFLLPWQSYEPSTTGKPKAPSSKFKYTCPSCGANAWGKGQLNLRCGDCDVEMQLAEHPTATGTAAA